MVGIKSVKFIANNKSQVTIFIILGIVISIALVSYLVVRQQTIVEEVAPGVKISLEKIPTEFDPIKNFVTSCLEDTSVKGLQLIGKQGGYINLESEYAGQSFIFNSDPTKTDAVEFAPGSELRIPYWYYLSSENDCSQCNFKSKRPSLKDGQNSIQNQLSKYVENNMDQCLDDFNALKQQGYKIEAGNKNVETKVTDSEVVVILNYDLNAEKEGSRASIEKYFVVLPVHLNDIYNLASTITNLEIDNSFLEKATINLISSFAGVDKEKLPPLTDLRFKFGSSTNWVKTDIKNKVSQILLSYMPLFQVYNTRNYNRNFFETNLEQSLYDDFIIPIQDEDYSNLEVNFNYLDFWPIYFDLNCNGEFCEPESAASDLLSIVGIQRYNFVYDVSFPVYVEINDPDAFNQKGFKFRYFLESNLRNNEPLFVDSFQLETETLSLGSQLCDLTNRNSGDVKIKVKDRLNNDKVGDVQVTYSVTDESCFLGSTDKDGALKTKFPTGAVGGVVNFMKNDYIKKSLLFDAGIEKKNINIKLDPIKTKKIIINKKQLVKKLSGFHLIWEFQDQALNLDPKEDAIITLTRISPLDEEEYSASTTYKLRQDGPSEMKIAPGKYEVTINLLLRDVLIIPEDTREVSGGFLADIVTGKKKYTIPAMEFSEDNPFPSGGLKLNVTLNARDLEEYDTVVFYAISSDVKGIPEENRVIEDLEETGKIEEYSEVYKLALQPAYQ